MLRCELFTQDNSGNSNKFKYNTKNLVCHPSSRKVFFSSDKSFYCACFPKYEDVVDDIKRLESNHQIASQALISKQLYTCQNTIQSIKYIVGKNQQEKFVIADKYANLYIMDYNSENDICNTDCILIFKSTSMESGNVDITFCQNGKYICVSHSTSRCVYIYDTDLHECIHIIHTTYYPKHIYTNDMLFPQLYIAEGPQFTSVSLLSSSSLQSLKLKDKEEEEQKHTYHTSLITDFDISSKFDKCVLVYQKEKSIYNIDIHSWNIINRWKAPIRSHGEYICIKDDKDIFVAGDDNELIRYTIKQIEKEDKKNTNYEDLCYNTIRGASKCSSICIQQESSTLFYLGIAGHLDIIYNIDDVFKLTSVKRKHEGDDEICLE
ncbi:hypothetical protein WA158_002683 [Blastocystis sp. Blastoise]